MSVLAARKPFNMMALYFILVCVPHVSVFGGTPAAVSIVDSLLGDSDVLSQKTILRNIELSRKLDVVITITASGHTLSEVPVRLLQFESDFLLGSLSPLEMESLPQKKVFKKWRQLFNFTIPENVFKWNVIEPTRGKPNYERLESLIESLHESGTVVELHFLTGYAPRWLEGLPDERKMFLQEKHAFDLLERIHGRVGFAQVFNEIMYLKSPRSRAYVTEAAFFQTALGRYPDIKLGVNDCWPWAPVMDNDRVPSPLTLSTRFPGIKFIGIHGHNPNNHIPSYDEIYKLLDPFRNSGISVHITELGVTQSGEGRQMSEEQYAVAISTMLLTTFSHPAVGAVNFWGSGLQNNRWTGNKLFDRNGTPTLAFDVLNVLFSERLRTSFHGLTDSVGCVRFRGLPGLYRLSVSSLGDGVEIVVPIRDAFEHSISYDANTKRVYLDSRPATLYVDVRKPLDGEIGDVVVHMTRGQKVIIAGLEDVARLEILDRTGKRKRTWSPISSRVYWDGDLEKGGLLGEGSYSLVATTESGRRYSASLLISN